MWVRLYEDITRRGTWRPPTTTRSRQRPLHHAAVADPEVRQPQARPHPGAPAVRRRPREADLRRAALHVGAEPRLRGSPLHDRDTGRSPARCAAPAACSWTRSSWTTRAGGMFVCSDTDFCGRRREASRAGRRDERDASIARCSACAGSPTTTARASVASTSASTSGPARCSGWWASPAPARRHCSDACAGRLEPAAGDVEFTEARRARVVDVLRLPEPARRKSGPDRLGHRPSEPARRPAHGRERRRPTSASGSWPLGARHYGRIRDAALDWLGRVEIDDASAIDDCPRPSPAACSSACRSPATS